MKTGWLILGLVLLVVPAAALFAATEQLPGPDGQEFWTYVTKTDDYTKWGFIPGHEGIIPGRSPHGKFVRILANDLALQSLGQGKPLPPGSMIVKENFDGDQKTLLAVTPMYRVQGYNPEGGDWFWAKYGPQGQVQAEGKLNGCLNCHASAKDRDWVFTRPK